MNVWFRTAYAPVEYVGLDKIPADGAVIMAPNHTNALMDALTVLTATKRPTVFVSRADIFRKPLVAKLLYFFKIMPIMRRRDGLGNLKKNEEIISRAVHVLEAGVPFCIFSEGTHRMQHSLLPLTKGIFRIALQCNDALQGRKPVYIVPMGIEYGSYTRYRHSLAVHVGDALNVSDFVNAHSGLDYPELVNALRVELAPRMQRQFHYVPDDGDYAAVLDLSYLRNAGLLAERQISDTPYNRMQVNRQTVDDVNRWKKSEPEMAASLLSAMSEFAELRSELKIDDESLYRWPESKTAIIWRALLLILLFPYALCCMILDLPVLVLQWLATHNLEDRAFVNSYRFVISMLLCPLVIVLLAVIAFAYLHWGAALVCLLLALPADMVCHDYVKAVRRVVSDWRLEGSRRLSDLRNTVREIIRQLR